MGGEHGRAIKTATLDPMQAMRHTIKLTTVTVVNWPTKKHSAYNEALGDALKEGRTSNP